MPASRPMPPLGAPLNILAGPARLALVLQLYAVVGGSCSTVTPGDNKACCATKAAENTEDAWCTENYPVIEVSAQLAIQPAIWVPCAAHACRAMPAAHHHPPARLLGGLGACLMACPAAL